MTTARTSRLALALGLAFLTSALPAHADERTEARRHFRRGLELISQRNYEDGIRELEAAYTILPHPNVLYNIARAYNDQGNTERAIEYLRRYLQYDVPDRAQVQVVVDGLEGRLRQQITTTVVANPDTGTPDNGTGSSTGTGTGTPLTGTGPSLNLPAGLTPPEQLRTLARAFRAAAERAEAASTGSANPDAGVPTAVATGPDPENPDGGAHDRNPAIAEATDTEDTYQERIVTASRAAQSPLDAPNATGIITAQDIRLSGLTSIPELLRRVAGIDIMVLEQGDVQVSARGFNQRLSNKMLVLVDGRSVYQDFLGVTLWPAIPVSVEDIERIEVIRGPGSALYGADAFTGVINIITKVPQERSVTQITLGGGNGSWLRGSFFTSGRVGSVLGYRASLGYEQRAAYSRDIGDHDETYRLNASDPDLSLRNPRANLDLQFRLGPKVELRAGFGISAPSMWFSAIGPLRRYFTDAVFIQPYVELRAQGLQARMFWNHFSAHAGPLYSPIGQAAQVADVQQDVVDFDANYSHTFRVGQLLTNTVQGGLNVRMKHISWNYLDTDHTLFFGAIYLQDTLAIGKWLSLVASARGDYNPVLAAPVFSPRGSIILKPWANRSFRFTIGSAFRTPTMLESFLRFDNETPIPGVSVGAFGGSVPGSAQQLLPETALSLDFGYRDNPVEWLSIEANAFWTRGANLIQLSSVGFSPLPGIDDPMRQVNVGGGGFVNDPAATYVYGGELGVKASPIDGLDLYANYTLTLTEHDPNALLAGNLGGGDFRAADQRTPMHKFNVGVQVRLPFGLDAELFGHYVSRQVWLEQVFDTVRGVGYESFEIPDYFVLNGRIGYRLLGDKLELSLTGTNLTDVRPGQGHREHPFGNPLSLRVMAAATYRF